MTTVTGRQIRERILDNCRGALGRRGKTTAVAGATDHITDELRYEFNTLPTSQEADAFVRIGEAASGTATGVTATTMTDTGASFSSLIGAYVYMGGSYAIVTGLTGTELTMSAGWVGGTPTAGAYTVTFVAVHKVTDIDGAAGDIYVDPATTDEIPASVRYELWRHGIWPDQVDQACDLALTTRCSQWRIKPLSVLEEIAEWSTAAYAYPNGGDLNAAATVQDVSFPYLGPSRSMLVPNSRASGLIGSATYKCQPGQQMRVFGFVSVRSGTATVKVVNSTASGYITTSGTASFTLNGWQGFELTFTVPTGCGEVELELAGTQSNAIVEWAGVGLLPDHLAMFTHESRVLSTHDIGHYFALRIPTTATGTIERDVIRDVRREQAAQGIVAVFAAPPACPVYYQERHRYAALQTDYLSKADRLTGDVATTDCPLDYIAWTTVVALLEPMETTPELSRLLTTALKEVRAWERRVGPDPIVVPQRTVQSGIPILQL